jgi:hypothetical protein
MNRPTDRAMDSETELQKRQRAADPIGALSRLHGIAALLLTAPADDVLWPERVRALAQRLGELQQRAPDAVLYLLYYAAVRKVERYSSHHALVCAATATACAQQLGWHDADIRSLACAALTMNVSITALQDELVYRERTLTLDQRLAVERHPAQSVELLTTLGVTDPLWLQAVELHHVDPPVEPRLEELAPGQRLAALLRRIDVLTAKMSPRNARRGMPPTLAPAAPQTRSGSLLLGPSVRTHQAVSSPWRTAKRPSCCAEGSGSTDRSSPACLARTRPCSTRPCCVIPPTACCT